MRRELGNQITPRGWIFWPMIFYNLKKIIVQKINPWGVIWVPSSRLMWADQLKKMTAVLFIYKDVHELCNDPITTVLLLIRIA